MSRLCEFHCPEDAALSTPLLLPSGYADAHHHIWAPVTRGAAIGYGWLCDIGAPKPFGDPTPIQRDYMMAEFLAEDTAAPRASVHIQTDGALPDPVAETAFVQAEADAAGHPVAIIGLADLSAPDLDRTLARHGQYRGFRGVRQIVARLADRPDLSFAPRGFLADPNWRDGLKRLEGLGLCFDLQLYPAQAEAALEALAATPALTVIIDHALSPYDASPTGFARWKAAVHLLAARPRTHVKLSGFGMYRRDWVTAAVPPFAPHIAHLLAEFGGDRVMWGSNYPVEKLVTAYGTARDLVADLVPPADRDGVFLHNIINTYSVTLP